ncbi:MAG: clostripain [Selenomonadaceae bacterium]|nr:clostripain [Selenomonadaceae bacterium]
MLNCFRRFGMLAGILTLLLFVSGCTDEGQSSSVSNATRSSTSKVSFGDEYSKDDTWLVYWYLCGTDLESNYGSASADFAELVQSKLPPNVKVLIQTGGTVQWQNEVVPDGQVTRFLYDNEDLKILETLPDADMGSQSTLVDFLRYGENNFKADHRVFVFWDHGGGTVHGVCFDERTGNSLSLNDIQQAFAGVYGESPEQPPFEIIGFDACLMATFDTASSIYGFSKYMVASEEVEPGNGWNYTGWVGALAKNPAIGGAALGKEICDSYLQGCQQYSTDDTATLSVVDLSRIPYLTVAYESFGIEALNKARAEGKNFFSVYGRSAKRAENYGGNNRQSGYTNMVDLGDLAAQSKSLLPKSSPDLISAIDEAVVYKVHGDYREKGSGLSGFYSYDGEESSLVGYLNVDSAPISQKLLYYYLMYGELPDEARAIVEDGSLERAINQAKAELAANKPVEPSTEIVPAQDYSQAVPAQKQDMFNIAQLEDLPVNVDDNGNAFVTLTQEQMDSVSAVYCQLVYISAEDDIIVFLGRDANVDADWDKGIFKDNFQATWAALDGHFVYMELTASTDEYNLYDVPIKLNGVECNLQVAYNYADNKYYILGARKGINDNGMGDRELTKLKAGDVITTIHYGNLISSDNDDLIPVEVDTFTLSSANPKFEDEDTGDGLFGYCFEFVSPTEDSALSQLVQFTVQNGEITTSVE